VDFCDSLQITEANEAIFGVFCQNFHRELRLPNNAEFPENSRSGIFGGLGCGLMTLC